MNSVNFFYINIERRRLLRSGLQIFYVLESLSWLQLQPSIHIISYSGKEYCVDVSDNSISYNCFDKNPACKHILFLLASTEMLNDVGMGSTAIHIPNFIHNLSTPSFNSLHYYELDGHTNKICVATHSNICRTCNYVIRHDLSICVRCFGVCHPECASVHSPRCSCCFHSRHYVQVPTCKSGYRDFTQLLTQFRWPLGIRPYPSTYRNNRIPGNHTQPPRQQLIDPQAVLVPDSPSRKLDFSLHGSFSNCQFIWRFIQHILTDAEILHYTMLWYITVTKQYILFLLIILPKILSIQTLILLALCLCFVITHIIPYIFILYKLFTLPLHHTTFSYLFAHCHEVSH